MSKFLARLYDVGVNLTIGLRRGLPMVDAITAVSGYQALMVSLIVIDRWGRAPRRVYRRIIVIIVLLVVGVVAHSAAVVGGFPIGS